MNQELLMAAAEKLLTVMTMYAASDVEAELFRSAMMPRIERALSGQMTKPLKRRELPGLIYFNEGTLRKYRDLEEAYADFAVEATGGIPPSIMAYLQSLKQNK